VATIANNWDDHILVTRVICKHFLESICHRKELVVRPNLALNKLGLDCHGIKVYTLVS
jgi:hypothetical protein